MPLRQANYEQGAGRALFMHSTTTIHPLQCQLIPDRTCTHSTLRVLMQGSLEESSMNRAPRANHYGRCGKGPEPEGRWLHGVAPKGSAE
jgi:hypothetical protein